MSDAEYFQNHKDDPDEWGDPVPQARPTVEEIIARADEFAVRFEAGDFKPSEEALAAHRRRFGELSREG